MALDLLGLGVSMLRCLAGSAVGFMVSKGIRTAASEGGGSLRTFLQKDIDQIREKLDSISQSKLSAALQNVRQGLILLDQQFSIAGSSSSSSTSASSCSIVPGSDFESAIGLCVTSRSVLNSEPKMEIPPDVRHQFQLAQQLAIEAFHDKRNVPAMLRVECLKVQLFCAMLVHYQQPERWLGLWTIILEESMKDKELAAAASAACDYGGGLSIGGGGGGGGGGLSTTTKSALSLFWRKSNADLSQAMCHLVENLHCALMAALWHPNVDARVAFGRSRILQYPRLLLCRPQGSASSSSQQHPMITVNLEAPFLYPWKADRIVVVLPSVFKLLSLAPTNKLLTAQVQSVPSANNSGVRSSFSLKMLDVLTLTEDETIQLETGERLIDVDFDRASFNLLVLSSTAKDGLQMKSYNLQFENNFKIKLSFATPCTQVISDPVTGAVIAFNGTSVDDEVHVLKQSKYDRGDGAEISTSDWFSYENIFKCMLADRPGSIRVAYAKPFRQSFGDDEDDFETGLEMMLYNRYTDVVYSLITTTFSVDEENMITSIIVDQPNNTSTSSTSTISNDDENMTKVQPIYPLKSPLLKVRVFDNPKSPIADAQKVMLEKGAIYEHDRLAYAKEKCLASTFDDYFGKKSPNTDRPPNVSSESTTLMGALVSNDDPASLHVFEVSNDTTGDGDMNYKPGDQLELPLICEQWEDRYLGGVICFGKFIFVGTLSCKVKLCDG